MDSKRRVNKVFNDNHQWCQQRGRPKNRWWNCAQILTYAKLQIGKRGQTTEVAERRPLRRGRSALD